MANAGDLRAQQVRFCAGERRNYVENGSGEVA
jgi:hypothetical protein